jgi:hypothetical protein
MTTSILRREPLKAPVGFLEVPGRQKDLRGIT